MYDKYDHYIAVDWAQRNMAIARMTRNSAQVRVIDVPSNIWDLKLHLRHLKGSKKLVVEETTTSQWLYTELKAEVDELVVCDPYRNRLLSEGAQNDKIDATKLVQLLRADLIKPVFHTLDKLVELRKLVSGYEDVVKAGVKLQNQRSALFRAVGKDKKEKELRGRVDKFVLEGLDRGIEAYQEEQARYEMEFEKVYKTNSIVRNLESIPGIGIKGAVKIAAIVVNAARFRKKNYFLSYSGLVKLELFSGGISYGKRRPRCNRVLKSVFHTAALSIMNNEKSVLRGYCAFLRDKGYDDSKMKNAIARRIATLAYGVLKSGKKFKFKETWQCETKTLTDL